MKQRRSARKPARQRLAIPRAKRDESVHDRKWSKHRHADGNEVPSPSHSGGGGLVVGRMAGLLTGGMGQIPAVLSGDAGEGSASGVSAKS